MPAGNRKRSKSFTRAMLAAAACLWFLAAALHSAPARSQPGIAAEDVLLYIDKNLSAPAARPQSPEAGGVALAAIDDSLDGKYALIIRDGEGDAEKSGANAATETVTPATSTVPVAPATPTIEIAPSTDTPATGTAVNEVPATEPQTEIAPAENPEAVGIPAETPSSTAPVMVPEIQMPSAVETAAPAEQPPSVENTPVEPAPEMAATQPLFIVRSSPILSKEDLDKRSDALRSQGYHPFARNEKLAGGEEYFVLELGRMPDMDQALGLLFELKKFDSDFFIIGTQATLVENGGLLPEGAERLFPYRGGAGGEDSLKLLTAQAVGPKTGQAYVTIGASGERKLVVRRKIEIGDMGSSATGSQITVNPQQQPSGDTSGTKSGAPAGGNNVPLSIGGPIGLPEQKTSVKDKLRSIAWDMRSHGFDVYFEGESFEGPEGVLVGMFDKKDDAVALGNEVQGYGYSVNIIQESGLSDTYYVYADPSSAPREMIIVSPDKLEGYRPRNTFNPPPDPTAAALLNLTHPE
jgi:hypothetical protein